MDHLDREALEAGLDHVRASPRTNGTLELIVRRPADEEREVVEAAELDPELGLVGDNWSTRRARSSPDGAPDPDRQLTLMNARAAHLVAQTEERWALAGDQLYVDLDLSETNAPAGTRLSVGDAVLQVTAAPHMGCAKFSSRFGVDSLRFVNSPVGRHLHLRGINARVVTAGDVRQGDTIRKLRDNLPAEHNQLAQAGGQE